MKKTKIAKIIFHYFTSFSIKQKGCGVFGQNRVATRSGKNKKFSKSGKSQGNLQKVRGKSEFLLKSVESQGIFCNSG